MKTIIVKKIKSEAGLMQIRQELLNSTPKQAIEIKETETGKTWVNVGGFNGNFWDLWLKKKGTSGQTKKTFIRMCVGKLRDIEFELKWLKIEPSNEFKELLEAEIKESQEKTLKAENFINDFLDIETAKKWVEKTKEGNSQKRKTKWGNIAERQGLPRYFGNLLRDKCFELCAEN